MFDAQLNGQQHWQELIHEADEYRRARNAEAGKKQSSPLRKLLSNILSSVVS